MIACRDIPDRADDFIDRQGALRGRIAVALHLAGCPHCRTYVRGLRLTRRIVAASFGTDGADAVLARLDLAPVRPLDPAQDLRNDP